MTAVPALGVTAGTAPRSGRLTAGVIAGAVFLAAVALAAVWPALLSVQDPAAVDPVAAFGSPSGAHLLGTDQLGRDVYSRIVHAARPTLLVGLSATAIAVLGGGFLGLLAIAGGRRLDEFVMRVNDVLLAFPGILLALLIAAVLGPGTANAALAVGAALVPGFARLTRGQALVVRESAYVRSAVTFGTSRIRVLVRHVLPNALPPVLAVAVVNIGTAMIAGSSMSFLGLGPPPPAPEWGAMLAEGRDYLSISWGLSLFPGLAITLTVLAVNGVGRRLQRGFEGR
jgi:peptide/nickel transport system permease protein